MSLRHALLAVLTAEPMTGYELVKYFDGSVTFVWNAPHSQIYPELRRMLNDGLLTVDEVPRGKRAVKRRYSISDAGVLELRRWEEESIPPQPERDLSRLRAAFFEWGTYDSARRQLRGHLNHYTALARHWQTMLDDLKEGRVPLLRLRVQKRPADEGEAIAAFKQLAFNGELARAKMEIAWAKEGLALLDVLERRGVPLAGDAPVAPSAPAASPAHDTR